MKKLVGHINVLTGRFIPLKNPNCECKNPITIIIKEVCSICHKPIKKGRK